MAKGVFSEADVEVILTCIDSRTIQQRSSMWKRSQSEFGVNRHCLYTVPKWLWTPKGQTVLKCFIFSRSSAPKLVTWCRRERESRKETWCIQAVQWWHQEASWKDDDNRANGANLILWTHSVLLDLTGHSGGRVMIHNLVSPRRLQVPLWVTVSNQCFFAPCWLLQSWSKSAPISRFVIHW